MGKNKTRSGSAAGSLLQLNHDEWTHVVRSLHLSPRESEILNSILQGHTDKQIATELGMSTNTVRTHLRHVFFRLNLTSRLELVMHVFALIHHQNG